MSRGDGREVEWGRLRSRWREGVVGGVLLVALLSRLAIDAHHDVAAAVLGVVIALLLVPVMFAGVSWVYSWGVRRARAGACPGAWVHSCVDPRTPYTFLSLVVDDTGVALVGLRGRVRERWPFSKVSHVGTGTVDLPGSLRGRQGLRLVLAGEVRQLLLPSRSLWGSSTEALDEAVHRISHKR